MIQDQKLLVYFSQYVKGRELGFNGMILNQS